MKLFLAILFLVLIVAGICAFISFIYIVFLPAFKKQKVDVNQILYSQSEMDYVTGIPDFPNTKENAANSTGLIKNNFHFWEKCYKIFIKK